MRLVCTFYERKGSQGRVTSRLPYLFKVHNAIHIMVVSFSGYLSYDTVNLLRNAQLNLVMSLLIHHILVSIIDLSHSKCWIESGGTALVVMQRKPVN